ncbi:hypothetical protein TNCV_802751 [Trichonephila clavipes]|nr:hypothetical protein TNCV_802751 [Trichonephila clavipes]
MFTRTLHLCSPGCDSTVARNCDFCESALQCDSESPLHSLRTLTVGHGTTPLKVKEDIEDVSSELGNEG